MFEINFNTGAGNYEDIGTIDEAMAVADKEACYTQKDIDIVKDGEIVATRRWYGTAPSDEDEETDIIKFGDSGFYDDWEFYGEYEYMNTNV